MNLSSLSLRKGNQPSIVSQLQVKRLNQDLANAHKKLEEYEVLIASLYDTLETFQSLACERCRATLEGFAPADSAATTAAIQRTSPAASQSAQPHSDSLMGNILSGHRAHSHPHSPNLSATSLVDALSQCRTATASPGIPPSEIGSELISTSSASNYDAQRPMYLHTSSISSASNNDDARLPRLQAPVLTVRDEPDSPVSWSMITFSKTVKSPIDVKLVDVLVYEEEVSCVKFSPDGNHLAIGLDSGQTYIYNMKLGEKTCILAELSLTHPPPKRDRIWSMSFSPDGKYLATGNQSTIIRIWDIAKRHVRCIFRHRRGVSGVDFSPDGRFVVSAAHDGTVCAWSMRDGSHRIYSDTDASYYSLRLTPDGRYVTATDYDGGLTMWDYRTGQEVGWQCHNGPATIAFMPDGSGLVTGSWDRTIKYWGLNFPQEGTLKLDEIANFIGHTNTVRGVTVLADGQWIVSASQDLTLRIWDSRTTKWHCTMKGHGMDIWWVDASPAGNYFASGGNDGRVAIWRCDPI